MKELDVIETLRVVRSDEDGMEMPVGSSGTIVLEFDPDFILVEFTKPHDGILVTMDRRDAKVVWECP